MTFEWYEPKAERLKVSISSSSITFYNQTVQAMNFPDYVLLGFNEEEKIIAVKTCRDADEKRIAFASKNYNSYIRINSRSFISYIELKVGKSLGQKGSHVKYFADWDENEETLYIYI